MLKIHSKRELSFLFYSELSNDIKENCFSKKKIYVHMELINTHVFYVHDT